MEYYLTDINRNKHGIYTNAKPDKKPPQKHFVNRMSLRTGIIELNNQHGIVRYILFYVKWKNFLCLKEENDTKI